MDERRDEQVDEERDGGAAQPTPASSAAAQPADAAAPAEPAWKRRQRLAEIFGDVLPSTTRDERDPGTPSRSGESGQDAWLRSQVPPHHGGH